MDFILWLFVEKKLGQSYDGAKVVYETMDTEAQEELKTEYQNSIYAE